MKHPISEEKSAQRANARGRIRQALEAVRVIAAAATTRLDAAIDGMEAAHTEPELAFSAEYLRACRALGLLDELNDTLNK